MTLSADLLAGHPRAVRLFNGEPTRTTLMERRAPLSPTMRTELVSILRRESSRFGPDDERERALQSLAANAEAIVTGQQPGLFGGPLLTLWKATTALRLAQERTAAGRETVAVFWNASEDHDLDEANRFFQIGDDGSVLLRHAEVARDGHPLESISFDAASLDELRRSFTETPWEFPLVDETFGDSMTRFIAEVFRGTGLLVLEPRWTRSLTAHFGTQVLDRVGDVRQAFVEGCRHVRDAGYSLQLAEPASDWTGLFFLSNHGRVPVRKHGAEWWIGKTPVEREVLFEAPDRLSCSAALRPLAQRTLLPVVAQVCGPSETAYLAQLVPLFNGLLEEELPLTWPRAGGILLRREDRNAATVLGLDDEMILGGPETWPAKTTGLPESWRAVLENLERNLREATHVPDDQQLDRLLSSVRRSGRRLVKDAKKTLEKDVRDRNKPRIVARHRLEQALWPRGRPQERTLSAASLHLDPRTVARTMIDAIDPWSDARLILDILEAEL